MTLAEICREANATARANGWNDEQRTFGDTIALIHSEASEALEEYRNGHGVREVYYKEDIPDKPEGVPIEMADIVIRIAHFCEEHAIDLTAVVALKLAYNKTRSHRHGGKRL